MDSQLLIKNKILDISVNLARVSDWVLSENPQKQDRVDQFLEETRGFLSEVSSRAVSSRFQSTLSSFQAEFDKLLRDRHQTNKKEWAERALTWANILQHRAKLA